MKKIFLSGILIIMFFFNNVVKAEYEKTFYDIKIESIASKNKIDPDSLIKILELQTIALMIHFQSKFFVRFFVGSWTPLGG